MITYLFEGVQYWILSVCKRQGAPCSSLRMKDLNPLIFYQLLINVFSNTLVCVLSNTLQTPFYMLPTRNVQKYIENYANIIVFMISFKNTLNFVSKSYMNDIFTFSVNIYTKQQIISNISHKTSNHNFKNQLPTQAQLKVIASRIN